MGAARGKVLFYCYGVPAEGVDGVLVHLYEALSGFTEGGQGRREGQGDALAAVCEFHSIIVDVGDAGIGDGVGGGADEVLKVAADLVWGIGG